MIHLTACRSILSDGSYATVIDPGDQRLEG
jgi:hypothetical protein